MSNTVAILGNFTTILMVIFIDLRLNVATLAIVSTIYEAMSVAGFLFTLESCKHECTTDKQASTETVPTGLNTKQLCDCESSKIQYQPSSPLDICHATVESSISTNTVHNAAVQQTSSGTITHPFSFVSAYPHSTHPLSTVTTYHQHAFETVDYIYFTPLNNSASSMGKGFHLLGRKVLPSAHTMLNMGPMPHQFLSSDHLLLHATFQFLW